MPARNYGTGPCFIYIKTPETNFAEVPVPATDLLRTADFIRVPVASRPHYLGVCQNFPTISNMPSWKDIKADSDGRGVSSDVSFDGQSAVVSCLLTEYDDAVANIVRRYQYPRGVSGVDNVGTRGNFLFGSGGFLELWLRWPHTSVVGNSVLLREPGRHYPYCYAQVDDVPQMGTSPMAIQLTFRCVTMRGRRRNIIAPFFYRFTESPSGGRSAGEGHRLQRNLDRPPNYWVLWDFAGFETLPPPTRQTAADNQAAVAAALAGVALANRFV